MSSDASAASGARGSSMPPPAGRLKRRSTRILQINRVNTAAQQESQQDSQAGDEAEPESQAPSSPAPARQGMVTFMRGMDQAAIIPSSPLRLAMHSQSIRDLSVPPEGRNHRLHDTQSTQDAWGGPDRGVANEENTQTADEGLDLDWDDLWTKWQTSADEGKHGDCDVDQAIFQHLYDTDIYNFIQKIVDIEMNASVVKNTERDTVVWVFLLILMSLQRPVLEGLIHGDLCSKLIAGDEAVKNAINETSTWADGGGGKQPTIYGQFLVDKENGLPITIGDLRQVLAAMQESLTDPHSEYRELLEKSIQGNLHRTIKRPAATKIRIFIEACRRRIEANQLHDDDRLPLPLTNIGYTASVKDRLAAHRRRPANSNYVMHCTMEITNRVYPGKYEIKQVILYHIPYYICAESAEVILTRLTQGYTAHGGGFAYQYAGLSNNSIYDVEAADWMVYWEHADEVGIIPQNLAHFTQLLNAKLDGLRKEELKLSVNKELLQRKVNDKEGLEGRIRALTGFTDELQAVMQLTNEDRRWIKTTDTLFALLRETRAKLDAGPPPGWQAPAEVDPINMEEHGMKLFKWDPNVWGSKDGPDMGPENFKDLDKKDLDKLNARLERDAKRADEEIDKFFAGF
ncbi:hypothetical protein MBLNU457_7258t1 [Dothideomycetes sp. NU457]